MRIARLIAETAVRVLVSCMVCALGAAAEAGVPCTAPDPNVPALRFEAATYDFGFAGLNWPITHRFRFTNEGRATLVIATIKSSCRCRVGGLTPWRVAPGGTGEILAVCNTGARTGPYEEVIRVCSNDPNQPLARLRIVGMVKTDFALDPPAVSFGPVCARTAPLKTLRLIDLSGGRLDLERVEAPAQVLVTNVTRMEEGPQRGFLIQVALNLDAPQGEFTVPLTLHTNLARQPHIDVPVTGNVLAALQPSGAGMLSQGTSEPVSVPRGRSPRVTRDPTTEDTCVRAWLIKAIKALTW